MHVTIFGRVLKLPPSGKQYTALVISNLYYLYRTMQTSQKTKHPARVTLCGLSERHDMVPGDFPVVYSYALT